MKSTFCDLPEDPITVGDTLIVNLRKEFPKCWEDTARQGIRPFSCCDPNRTKMCDMVNQCAFARGFVHQRLVDKSKHKVFIGWYDTPVMSFSPYAGCVVVWWTQLPSLTQSLREVDLKSFFSPLIASNGSRVKDGHDGNANGA